MAAALPHALEQRLAALVPRLRALRVARGASFVVLAAIAATTFVLLLDAIFTLPATARGLFIAVWVTAIGVFVWRWVVQPWQAEISLSDVAKELEKRLPELGERLRAVVSRKQGETSEAVRAALAEDAARRAKAVDFRRAIPSHRVTLLACGALLAFLSLLIAAGLVPNSADRFRRVAMPWARPPGAAFRVVVTSGEPVVKRGGPVTLSAYAEKIDARSPAPDRAALVFRDSAGAPEQRLPMVDEGGGVFHVTRPYVPGDFEYRVEVGTASSGEWLRVTALDAVELAEGTRVEVTPPEYATTLSKRSLTNFTDFEGLEFSTVTVHLKFTQPAAAAHFEWRFGGETKPEQTAVELAPDRLSATATLRLLGSGGALRLVLLREVDGKKLRTGTVVNVRVTRDAAPWFEQVSGITSRPRTARPDARVPIDFVARDDLNVSTAVLEYVLDSFDSKSVTTPVPLTGVGTARATGRLDLDLAGKGREGDTIRFRIRVTDNRRAGGDKPLAPQEAFYPATGWSELRLSATAPPLVQQDILCQRDAFRESAEVARLAAREAAETVLAVRTDAAGRTTLAVDHSIRLNNACEKIRRTVGELNDLARDAALTPELRLLATAVREIADRELKAAEDAIRKAESDEAGRADAFATAIKQLGEAGDKLDALLARNAKLAQDRLDRAKLGALATDQSALANATKAGEKELLARQQQLLKRLKGILAEGESLRLAAEGAKGAEARRLALNIAELATLLRDLDHVTRQTATLARDALVADIARDQEALAKRAAKLFGTVDTAAGLAGVAPPKLDDFRRVTELAAAGKTVEALTELEKQAQALERIAVEFDKWAGDRTDPKRGAKQLALWQDDFLTRFRAATKGTDFDKLPEEAKTAFRDEQKALHVSLALLALPPDDAVKAARDNAMTHTDLANKFLADDGRGADTALRAAVDSLHRLADKTPAVADRLAKTRGAFDKLKQEQDTLANAVEQVLRSYEGQSPATVAVAAIAKKLAPLVERQRKLIPATAALDLPGLGDRQARLASVLKLAVADLQDGSPFDVLASQLWARREFERLKLVLDGHSSPDAKADELHRKLGALADALDAHGANLTAKLLEPAGPVVQDAQKQLGLVVAVESPTLLTDAKAVLQAADSGFRDGSKPDEVRRRIRAAANALGKLSDRLNGFETDLERVQRLADNRRLAAVKAKELADAKTPFNPAASDEALRQLLREIDELTHTRVGAAGQLYKKRALELYARLRAKNEPDRFASDQKAVAEALDELAAKMADIAELATNAARDSSPVPPTIADAYLPSKPLAEALRDLVKQQRTLHDQLTNFSRALADRLRPAPVNAFTELEAKQRTLAAAVLALAPEAEAAGKAALAAADRLRTGDPRTAKNATEATVNFLQQLTLTGAGKPWGKRVEELASQQQALLDALTKLLNDSNAATAQQIVRAEELAGKAAELSRLLELAASGLDPLDATAKALADAATVTKDAAKRLLEAAKKSGATNITDAAGLRAEADALLRAASNQVSDAAPKSPAGADLATGDALRRAELAMRKAIDDLASNSNPAAERAMRDAADALTTAAKSVSTPIK